MARAQGTTVYNTFVNGLVTEATGLNFPENAVTAGDNCVFDRTGVVYRRLGMDYETDYDLDVLDYDGVNCCYYWEAAGEDGDHDFIVVQVGRYIRFYALDLDNALSPGFKTFSIDLTAHKSNASTTTQTIRENKASFSSGLGYLFVAHKYCEPMYVVYNSVSDIITTTEITIYTRDFEGIDDGLDDDERPSSLSLAHEYNLQNQGWVGPIQASGGSNSDDPLGYWDAARTDWPSNCDVWFLYKNANQVMIGTAINTIGVGNSPASKGHYIYDAFNIQRKIIHTNYSFTPYGSSYATFPGEYTVESETTDLRPQFTEFYAGRVWWAGVQDEGFSSRVYFSKVIESTKDFGKCHMINDPTAEHSNDLLATDGGVIKIPDATNIVFMKAVGDSVLIFARNGIWSISGTSQDSFAADSFEVKKISEIGALSEYSFVSADNVPFWWNNHGIYALQGDQFGSFSVSPVSLGKIKTLVDAIPHLNKNYVQGMWDKNERTITWIYRTSTPGTFAGYFSYDKILVFNIDTQAFYTHTVSYLQPVIKACINTGYEDKYLTTSPTGTGTNGSYTWSEMSSTTYMDWYTYDSTGVTYESYFMSGYKLRGESIRDFQTNYVTFTSEVLEDSSFLVSGRWDYAINELSNRFTSSQQGYKHDANYSYTQRKLKFRGNGKVLQYKVTSQTGKPFKIAGWVTYDTVNAGV